MQVCVICGKFHRPLYGYGVDKQHPRSDLLGHLWYNPSCLPPNGMARLDVIIAETKR